LTAEHQEPCVGHTAGFLLREGNDFFVIAQSWADEGDPDAGQGCGLMTIPAGCVKKVTELVAKPGHPP